MRRRVPLSSAHYPMGDDIAQPTITDPTSEIVANTRKILAYQKADADARKVGWIIAGVSALFAAAKLGLVAIPMIRKSREP